MVAVKAWQKLGLTVLLLFALKPACAQDLFSLKLKVAEAAYAQGVPPLLKQAVAIELVKLTGNPQIDPAVMGYFTKRPMRWIRRYFFTPYLQQGVKMGYWLNLEFDKTQLLDAMAQQHLEFWPASARPTLLASAIWAAYGSQVQITEKQVQRRAELDLTYVGQLFGIPIKLPAPGDEDAFKPVLTKDDIEALNQRYQIDGLLRGYFEEHFKQVRTVSLDWELILPSWSLHSRGTEQGNTPLVAFEKALSQLLLPLRSYYLAEADIETEAEVFIFQPTAEQVLEIESRLLAGRPLLHTAFLQSASHEKAVFRVRFRGGLDQLHAWLMKTLPQDIHFQVKNSVVKPVAADTPEPETEEQAAP